MDSTAFSPSSWSNSTVDKTLVLIFGNLDREMDLMIGSFNYRIGSLGTLRLSDPISSGLSANKTAAAATLETFVGSSSDTLQTYL
jgi:hypothetical protein